jgi:hypothetical protein
MIPSSLVKLDEIQVCKLFYEIDGNYDFKGVNASDIDFNFFPLDHKDDKTKKRIFFQIFNSNKKIGINFDIVIVYDYSFVEKKNKDEEIKIGVGAIMPQIVSFVRGILFSISRFTSRPVTLPSINVIESIKKLEMKDKNKSNKSAAKQIKKKKSN